MRWTLWMRHASCFIHIFIDDTLVDAPICSNMHAFTVTDHRGSNNGNGQLPTACKGATLLKRTKTMKKQIGSSPERSRRLGLQPEY